MSDVPTPPKPKRSKTTIAQTLAILGTLSWSAADHSTLASVTTTVTATSRRVDFIEASRERRIAKQDEHNIFVEKCLFAIMRQLKIPEPRR